MIFTKKDGMQTATEPPVDQLKSVIMTAEEFLALQHQITQLKQPWIRNANKDREIRPARSSPGYVLKSIRDIVRKEYGKEKARIKLELETPYQIGSFDFSVAKDLIRGDVQQLCETLRYDKIYFAGEKAATASGRVMYDVQVIADDSKDFYRIQAYANAEPIL